MTYEFEFGRIFLLVSQPRGSQAEMGRALVVFFVFPDGQPRV